MRCLHGFAFTLLLLTSAYSQSLNDSLAEISNSFSSAGLVPDVIPVFRPSGLLNTIYTMAGEEFEIITGEQLPTALTDSDPEFTLTVNTTTFNSTGPFVLVMLDTSVKPTKNKDDAPPILHLLRSDYSLSTSDDEPTLTSTTEPLADYHKPAPPANDDPHRFVVLLYNQPANFSDAAAEESFERETFNITGFVEAVRLGQPIAGNHFLIEPVDSDINTKTTRSTSTGGARPSFTQTEVPHLTPLIGDDGSAHKNAMGMVPLLGACLAASLLLLA